MEEVSFGEWLKRRRNAVGLTQEQLALQISCSTSALRKFESEERRPSAEVVDQLADFFNIPQEERKSFLRFARGDWQAIPGGDADESPWLVSSSRVTKQVETIPPKNNLPSQLTSFIGREKEQAEIIDLLTQHRLVTLVGAGGIGKTRLSLEAAREALNTFPDGLWFIELAPLSDPALVPQAIVNTLGLIEQANRSFQTLLTDFLKDKKALLLLDNCEHLIQACAQLTEALLRACSNLKILATSREALGISGEFACNVATLSTPDIRQPFTAESLTEYEAVRLFLDRAQTTVHNFTLTQDNLHGIAQICHHLDGIPLALELAAARVRGLSVDQIAARLDDRFHLLTSGARTVLPRHQTLQALIDWSHELLTMPEQTLLRRLSVFAGGWTLEAAEAACADDSLESNQILDLLVRLVDKSLVVAETQKYESRYHMLETIRQYASEKLWQAGEGDLMRQRHLACFVDLAERAEPNLRAFDMVIWLDRLETELDNIRAALEYALENDIEAQLRLVSALLWFWHIRGHRNEGIEWLERALSIESAERGDQPLTPDRAMIRGKALNTCGILSATGLEVAKATERLEESLTLFKKLGPAGKQGAAYALMLLGEFSTDSNRADMLEQSCGLFREIGDRFGVAESLGHLAESAQNRNNYSQARIYTEEQLALRREIGDQDGIAGALAGLGDLALWQDDYQQAITLYEESLAIFRKLGNKWATGFTLSGYGDVCLWQGAYKRATEIYQEAFAFAQDLGDRFLIAFNVYGLGVISWFHGDNAQAIQKITNSLTVFRDMGHDWLVASSLHSLGNIALAMGEDVKAAQWYEAELAVAQGIGFNLSLAFAFCGLGKLAWIEGNDELAIKRFEEGLKVGREADLKTAMFHTFYGLGRVAQSQGNYSVARAYYGEMLGIQQRRISPPSGSGYWLKNYGCAVAYPLEAFATLAGAQNQLDRSTRLFGVAEILYPPLRFAMSDKERVEHDQSIAASRAALGEEAFVEAYEEGKKMSLDEAVAYALQEN